MILTPPGFFGMTTSGLEYGEVECWINPAARYWLRGCVHFFDQNRVYAMGPGCDRSTALRDRDLEGHQGARPKVRLRGGEHIGKFTEHTTEVFDGRGVHPGSCKSNTISLRCGCSRIQTRKNEERWSGFNHSSSAGEGHVTGEAASPGSGELVTAETWQSAV